MDDEEYEQIDCTNLSQQETDALIRDKLSEAEKSPTRSDSIYEIEDDDAGRIENHGLGGASTPRDSVTDDILCLKFKDAKEKFIEG